ncbi:DNA methyltransferase [uncultured Croceicoccus sp.]|uniref:class I SAM-dependent DNA methyltransferase n=1 Tax=uncultured Croceicoccus sp. TaxID=1295329 RepID=UPI0026117E99|nr:DNA methyltransferase [uncultured Croceicoccus sp.]
MNPVEIEDAVTQLAAAPFDGAEFPFQFLAAFGNRKTTIDRLKKGNTNQSDIAGGVLQRSNIHMAIAAPGRVAATLDALRNSPKSVTHKAKFILATDGHDFQAEDMVSGETVVCEYAAFPDHFGFFLPLAGITTVEQIRESSFDIRATGRLNKLYVTLLQDNPEWAAPERRTDMNHFMARLIFCFFAEDTDIFHPGHRFTATVERMSAGGADNTADVIAELFRAMNTPIAARAEAGIPRWADGFPYVNGNLFSGSIDVPRFSKIARSYLIHIGNLDWTRINPDIFGSMIQAVADDEERGALGMHYTSVPNILKVLNPLFLDDLRGRLEEAGDNARKLRNLRARMAKIRVFDPACGSGNFLVIAYKEMRGIEAEINRRRGEPDRKTDIPLTNFRGIELRDFPAEIARLALIIAEYQCDVLYRGQKEALAEFLPLDSDNWITCGNALRLDWLSICPPTGTGVKMRGDDLLETPLDQSEIDFENAGGETYICGNPPYRGSQQQSSEQKIDLEIAFEGISESTKALDYVAGWFAKATKYITENDGLAAFVATNSINQGRQVEFLWSPIFSRGIRIFFAAPSFLWKNLASHNAGVTVSIVGLSPHKERSATLYFDVDGEHVIKEAENINGYLVAAPNIEVSASRASLFDAPEMSFGNMPNDRGALLLSREEARSAKLEADADERFIRQFIGSQEFINGIQKYCIWVRAEDASTASENPFFNSRFEQVRSARLASNRSATNALADTPFAFGEVRQKGNEAAIIIPRITSERRPYLPVGLIEEGAIVSSQNFAIYDPDLWVLACLASRIHRTWIATVCGRTRTDFAYSNTLGWNTFPLPKLTEQNKADLTRCAENILLAREAHFPATIADLYDPDAMPDNLRRAHEENDEVLERIYIGRRFRNDTERLEKLFELYTKMTARAAA